MAERLSNLGYFAFIKEAVKGTPLTPTTYLPIYEETMSTNGNLQTQQPIYGNKFATFDMLRGQRDHQGDVTTLAEANTTAQLQDFFLTKSTTTGAGPYTHTFGLSATADPQSATVDVSTGNIVRRYWGFQISSFSPDWSTNELRHKIKASALGSFQGRTIATVTTTTLTLDTKYDPAPNKGLVVGDLVRIFKASTQTVLDTTIATVNADGITVTLALSAAAFAAGDTINLRPVTNVTFNLLDTFLWARTEVRFGATASAALAATQTRVEDGSTYELMHPFEDDAGSKRSGGFDPAALIRMQGDGSITVKVYFDTPERLQAFNDLTKSAIVFRHFAGSTNQYEYRITFNAVTTDTPVATISAQSVNYATITYWPSYNQTDGAAMSTTVINALATI